LCIDPLCYHFIEMDQVFERLDEFDVLHFHTDYLHFPLSRWCRTPHVTTLHGRLDMRDLLPLYRRFHDVPVVSISNSQRRPLPWLNWQGTVYHGLTDDLYSFRPHAGGYLAFLGRLSPEKRVDRAIDIARRCGVPLKIAAKVDAADKEYYARAVQGLLDRPGVEFIGEIGEREKAPFLGNAMALLFPIDWPEPFGMVMIEALACGTPVVAWRCGSVPEVIRDGVTGFICESIEEAVRAVERVPALSRSRCRQEFETRFRAAHMVENYVRIYQRLMSLAEPPRTEYARSHSGPGSVLHSGIVRAAQ
jgi:glycosyltransferase involved in cell wall biosynthesis